MIRKNLIKAFALGLCMSTLWAGAAYAQSGSGVSPAYVGSVNTEDTALFEKQRELDQYLFVDHVKEIEKMGFTVIYTGVADTYVEVGITPFSEENANKLYDIFGKELVKVVKADQVVAYSEPADAPDMNVTVSDNEDLPVMDNGNDTSVSSDASLEIEQREKEILENEKGEEFSIQIESFEGAEPDSEIMEYGAEIYATGAAEDDSASAEDLADIKVTATQDNIRTVSADNDEEIKKLSVPGLVSILAGGIIVIGGTVVAMKKKEEKESK